MKQVWEDYKKIVDCSESNIKVAFENTKIKGYLDYVNKNIIVPKLIEKQIELK